MESRKPEKQTKGFPFVALISSLFSVAFCSFLICTTIIERINVEKIKLEQQVFEKTHLINEIITLMLYKTQALSAVIVHDDGNMDSFDIIAPSLVDDPAIQNVLLAPDGIVAKAFPFEENEKIIGWNFFDDKDGNREAMIAIERGELVLGGPIDIVQGGRAIFGRLPVFIDDPEGEKKFWGLISITLKFPQVLDHAELDIFDAYGASYELWRINPDTNEKQVMISNDNRIKPGRYFIENSVNIFNAEWYLKAALNFTWYSHPDNIALITAGLLISLIVFLVMQNNHRLKNMQNIFEQMATTDPLLGIFNRRHFMELVRMNIEKARRIEENCFFILFDIDKFKDVNDAYGHHIGDMVLMEVTARIKSDIRPYDLFARYGGEEFIVYASNLSEKDVCDMAERLRVSLCDRKFEYDDISISISASFGIAYIHDYDVLKAMNQSDEAMYAAKRKGRNSVVYFNESASES